MAQRPSPAQPEDFRLLRQAAAITLCNPFTPERQRLEREASGSAGTPRPPAAGASMSVSVDGRGPSDAYAAFVASVREAADCAAEGIAAGTVRGEEALRVYEDAALYVLYERFQHELIAHAARPRPGAFAGWSAFQEAFARRLRPGGVGLPSGHEPGPVLACFFQIRRAFEAIYPAILGTSAPAARLRAACWESVFTHDLRTWYGGLMHRMRDFPTLVLGPSGTGKELVARALSASAHLPFDPRTGRFAPLPPLLPVSLAALPGTLIESELFGHARGAFTGATADRDGWLAACPAAGVVFLDEIGELDPLVQVKLLRVLQERAFTRVGETSERRFEGKVVAATHRDLPADAAAGRFRHDLYHRLAADVVTTPALAEVLRDQPGDLAVYARFLAGRALGRAGPAADALAERTLGWIDRHLGPGHPWPGNVRELEQCVRGVLLRGDHAVPAGAVRAGTPGSATLASLAAAGAGVDEVRVRFVREVHLLDGTLSGTARRVGLDRRTVKRLLAERVGGPPGAPDPEP